MKKEKNYASLCYLASVFLYLVGGIILWKGNDTSLGISCLCLGSAMLCFGGVFLNKMNKKDGDK